MYLVDNYLPKTRLVKVIAFSQHGNKLEKILSNYSAAKMYAKQLDESGFSTIFEITPFYTYEELCESLNKQIEEIYKEVTHEDLLQ